MMKVQRVFVLSAVLLAVSQAAYADEGAQLLDEVVVSASKIEQSTVEAPANVSVITSSKIEKTNNQRLGDALSAKVPGL